MSAQQSYSEYLYFTITQDSDFSSQDIMQHYELEKICGGKDHWDKHQLNDEKTHQFSQMCIRINIGEVEYRNNFTDQISRWLHYLYHQTKINQLPQDFQKSLHLVTHDVNFQGAGFHLTHALIRELVEHKIDFCLHGYLDADDEQDFPFSQRIATHAPSKEISEYAYFYISSDQLTASELQALLPELQFEITKDQGKNSNGIIQPQNSTNSSLKLRSRLATSEPINAHIQDVLDQFKPYQQQLQHLFFNADIACTISATGHLENPHHRHLNQNILEGLFLYGFDLDADLYFN